jgi:acetylornithine deacetylase/succinyl-diaminopimelate desuccinylase-like protein
VPTTLANRAASWLSRLVQIPSVTPVQAGPKAGEPGEARIADALAGWFAELGGIVEIEAVQPGRPSVYAIWPGQTDAWVAVDVHTDTVGVEQMTQTPFSGAVNGGRVWGRGAVDTKASLGVLLALLEHTRATGQTPVPGLVLGATVDEEFGATGAPAFAAWLARRPFAIAQIAVAEPTQCVPVYGHRGVARFELTFRGEPAHSSQPDLGRNAIVAAASTVLAYAQEHSRLQQVPPAVVGRASLTSTIIHGGTGINVVPDVCTLLLDRRTVDGEDPATIIDALHILAQHAGGLPVSIRRLREIRAFLQPPNSPLIASLALWSGSRPNVAPYGTNAWAYLDLPAEKVVIGPGSIDQAHGAEEWVEVAQLGRMAEIYARWWGISL